MRSVMSRTAILTLLLTLPCCGSESHSTLVPTPPGAPYAFKLSISAPPTIAPGSTVQLSATAGYTDGSSKDVTGAVVWLSSDQSILTISNAGLASTHQSGEPLISARLNSTTGPLQAGVRLLVIPSGTFKLSGRVTWQGGRDLAGAAVQVTSGIGSGLAAVTAADGSYALYGVAGDIALTISKAEYQTIYQTARIDLNTTLNFDMVTVYPLPSLAGDYTLQISADPACAAAGPQTLPDSARVRRYTATVDNEIRVSLSEATFLPHANFMFGYATPDGAILDVNHLDYYYGVGYPPPDLGEVLPDGNVYSPSGTITLSTSGADLVGTLNGAIKVWGVATGSGLLGQCTSTHHAVTFTKQSGTARIRAHR